MKKLASCDYKVHLVNSFVTRLVLVAYGIYHDQISTVPYTDIDYKVFTDASRHMYNGSSPYDRLTYRYSPLLALLLIPNLTLHYIFGKILFCLADIAVATLIHSIVLFNIKKATGKSFKLNLTSHLKTNENEIDKTINKNIISNEDLLANVCMLCWLYNPLTIAISTRGNCDSLAGLLVLLTLHFLQCRSNFFTAGVLHGLSIHFRLYPLAYSLTFFMFLSDFAKDVTSKNITNTHKTLESNSLNTKEKRTIFKMEYFQYIIPNKNQLMLVLGCLLSLFACTSLFYVLYGYTFLYETYIYHLIRKDTRHNFSVYFYLQYLTSLIKNIGFWQKALTSLPQVILLIVLSFKFGLTKASLNFGILVQTIVMVAYNTVLTSQYFVWIMVVMPLSLWQIKFNKKIAFLIFIWFVAQVAWLLPAYLLEFHGRNTFFFIWVQSISLFCAHIAILGRLIMHYNPYNDNKID